MSWLCVCCEYCCVVMRWLYVFVVNIAVLLGVGSMLVFVVNSVVLLGVAL